MKTLQQIWNEGELSFNPSKQGKRKIGGFWYDCIEDLKYDLDNKFNNSKNYEYE